MRPKKFDFKPGRRNPNRLRRTSRKTSELVRIANRTISSFGTATDKATQIAAITLAYLPRNKDIKARGKNGRLIDEKRIFRRSATDSLRKKQAIGVLHCAERCNLAIALLTTCGEKAWLVRFLRQFPPKPNSSKPSWEFHDVVEFVDRGKIKTLVFEVDPSLPMEHRYSIVDGTIDSLFRFHDHLIFRGADSKQIGGVSNWVEFEAYEKRLNNPSYLKLEVEKNKRRIQLLLREGVIPKEVENQLP